MDFDRHLDVGRPMKTSPQATVEYEMEMLQFAWKRINAAFQESGDGPHRWVYIECFLLHYRNLIELFGVSDKKRQPDDLSIEKTFCKQIKQDLRLEIERTATPLRKKYAGSISKYLAHCTVLRHELDRDWYTNEMYAELLPAIHVFRNALGLRRREEYQTEVESPIAAETTTSTHIIRGS